MIDLFHSLGQIFMQLFNVSMTAGWFVLAVVLIRLLLKKAPKWISCVLWGMVAIRLVMPFSIESALSLVPSAEPLPVTNIYKSGPDISGNLIYRNVNSGSQIFDAVVGTAMRETNSISVLKDNFSLLACIWILGMLAMLIYTVVSCFKINKKLNEAMPLRDNVWLCDRIDSPFIFGLIKPRIFLPSDMNEADMDFVIAHETAHLKRRDHWWKPLGFMLLTVYWFNPVLWIAYILLCKDIELACDEKVISEMGVGIKKDYSNALINCSVPRKSIAACPLAFGETGVKGRIKSVLNYKKPAFWIIIVAVIASIVLAVCFLTNPIDNSSIFNAKYETGECLFDDVVTEDKQTNKNELSFGINSTGGVYKDYGNGEGEYIGELKDSVFSANELNSMIEEQGGKRINIGKVQKIYEISDDNGKKDYVFFHKKNGDVAVVMFFSDGGVMSVFNLIKIPQADNYAEHNNSLGDELSVFIDGRIAEHFQNEKSVNHACCVDYEVLGKRKIFGETTLYLWVMYQEYSYDGVLKEESGAHIPTAITVRKENGGYKLVEYWEPRDGSYYAKDIKDKFPFYLHNKGIDSQRYVKQQIARCEALAMEHFGIDYAQYGGIEGYNSVAKNRPLTLSDVITLSDKKEKLTWSDFEEFRYIETGSGLYIRHYEIDEMFSLLIGGSGPDEEPMYIYLHASDAWDFRIDIRQSDVEAFINEHQKNPVVKNLSASWHCIPVGYNEKTYSKMMELGEISFYAFMSKVQCVPVVKIEDVNGLQSFMQKMNGFMNFDNSYSDVPSFNEVKAEYNEEFFETSSLLLAYTSSSTTAHRYTVDNITKSAGVVTVNIAEIDPEGGDTAMEGWLVAVRVSKEDITDAEKIDALISTVYLNQMHLDNAVKTAISQKNSETILKGEYSCAAYEILKSEKISDESQNLKIKLYLTTCYASYSTKNNELETMGLIPERAVMTFVQNTDGTLSLLEYYVPIKGDNSDEAKKLYKLSFDSYGESLSEICRMDAQKHLGTNIKSEESEIKNDDAGQIIKLRLEDVLSKEISSVEINSSTRLLREQEPIRVTEEQKEKILSYISDIQYSEAVDYQRGFGSNYIVKLNYADGSSAEIVFMDKYFYIYSSDGQSVYYVDETDNSVNLAYYIVDLIS